MITINMRSVANSVKGQGVGSCYEEQVNLVKKKLSAEFKVTENGKGRFDIVHYHTVNPNYFIERIITRRKTIGVGYVHFLPATLDDSIKLPYLFRKVFYWYLLKFYNSMDYLVTVNPFFIDQIREHGINHPKVSCIYNFVSTEHFHPVSLEEKRKIRKHLGIDEDAFVVLGVGQLQTRKGVFDFVETAKRLPDVHFAWAGGFSFGVINEGFQEIKEIKENPPDNVSFLGIIEREEMPLVYQMADLMFLPSFDELFPMSILEALCCKLPVLVRDIPLYEQILFDYCLKGKSVDDFVAAVSSLKDSQETYRQWREKSWQCHMMYTEEKAAENWKEYYTKIYEECKNVKAIAARDSVYDGQE